MQLKLASGNLAAAQRVKESQRGMQALNAILQCRTQYRIFYRLTKDEESNKNTILTAQFPERGLGEELQCNSVYILEDWEMDQNTGKFIDNTEMRRYANIARVLHKADCENAKKKIEREKKLEAQDLGTDLNDPAFIANLNKALIKCEVEYFGDKELNAYPDKRPVIGGIRSGVYTELAIVPLTSAGLPDWSKAANATWDLTSGRRQDMLAGICTNASFCADGDQFLEVSLQYGMNTNDKKEAGKNFTLNGVPKSDSLAVTDPEGFAKFKADYLDKIADDPMTIAKRSMAAAFTKTSGYIIESFKKWVAGKSIILRSLDLESEEVKNVANDLVSTGIAALDATVQTRLIDMINSGKVKAPAEETKVEEMVEGEEYTAENVQQAQSIKDMMDMEASKEESSAPVAGGSVDEI